MTSSKWKAALRRAGIALGAALIAVPMFGGVAAAASTGTIAVCATDSTGANIVLGGDQAWYQVGAGSTNYVGAVGVSGCREQTVPANTNVNVWVAKQGTRSQTQTVQVADGGTTMVNFYTTNVTIQYPGSVAFGGPHGDSAWFKSSSPNGSNELFSDGVNPTMFRADSPAGAVRDIAVSWPVATGIGQHKEFSLSVMRVRNNDGTGEAGATATAKYYYSINVPGSTNSAGLLGWAYPGLQTNATVTAKINGTWSDLTEDVSTDGLFDFQTTNLTLHYNDSIIYMNYYGYNFAKPSMELFAGTYPFLFRSGPATGNPGGAYTQTSITVPDPSSGPVVKTAAVVRFQDSTGAGLVGSVSYYLGGWHSNVATTDMTGGWNVVTSPTTPGSAVILFDGAPTNVVFSMNYQGQVQQLAAQNIQTNSVAYFHTTDVTLQLTNSLLTPLYDPSNTATASYYANGWHTIGDIDASKAVHQEMLPGSYSFAMTYVGTRLQLNAQPVSGPTSTVSFKAVKVDGVTTNPTTVVVDSYYANGWRTFQSGMFMLPGSYTFHFTDGRAPANQVKTVPQNYYYYNVG